MVNSLPQFFVVASFQQTRSTVSLSFYKGNALDRGNYRELKLTEQAMKILETIFDSLMVLLDWLCPRKRNYRCNL